MSPKRIFHSSNAAPVVGPFSQGTTNGDLVFTSGQIAITPEGESLTEGSVDVQTKQYLENISAILEETGGQLSDVLKSTVSLSDIETYEEMNVIYRQFFDDNPPARTAPEVANLPLGADVEIQAVANIQTP
jgi:reactive intermediate/imine deaminase